jgi:hypothetical protein
MDILPNRSLLERLAIWVLHRSPRISLVVVKDRFWPEVFFSADMTDPAAAFVADGMNDPDPPSMVLERLYHMPAHGEQE